MKYLRVLALIAACYQVMGHKPVPSELPMFRSSKLKLSEYVQDPSTQSSLGVGGQTPKKEFFIQKEIDQQFGNFNISLAVDIVWINNVEKPRYKEPQPKQQFNSTQQPEFQANVELLQNAFRSSYYRTAERFQDVKLFPYREDNKPKLARSSVFQKDYSGNEVDLRFHISSVPFNSRLNAELLSELQNDGWNEIIKEKFSSAILWDYVANGRQFAIYIVDCGKIDCWDDFRAALNSFNTKHQDKLRIRFFEEQHQNEQFKQEYVDELIVKVAQLISNEFEAEEELLANGGSELSLTSSNRIDNEGILMFEKTLPSFLLFLRTEYFPRISQFKFESSVYKFESPLNFLMLRSDFKEFLENFYQSEALLQYALKFHIDSIFTVPQMEDKVDHRKRKQESSYLMLKSLQSYMYRCVEILREYDHLVPHDTQAQCMATAGQGFTLGCFIRKYGVTLTVLGSFATGTLLYFKKKIEDAMRKADKKKA